ncbi:hypothetical protein [Jatrophihabitans sp.]|uniref:hypothetical protein n=1 Tax=Jatrophihabitans sp. TaxID=1932789 RepID=UPI0030C67DA8|nr:hypothetical protein [Jatrophihabitans sp.]
MAETAWHIQLFGTSVTAPVRWRLLSGNNRDMGRGFDQFDDAETCRLAIKQLQADAAELESRIQRVAPSRWQWQIVTDKLVVAAAGHPFDRLIRCEQGMSQFLEHFGTAPIGASVMLSDARRWRTALATPA